MTEPFRLQLGTRITDTIASISPDDGYAYDLRPFDPGDGATMSRVFRGRAWFGDTDPIPMVSLLEGTNPADDVYEQPDDDPQGAFDWDLLVQGFVQDDPVNPTDPAYRLLRDVRRRLFIEKSRRVGGGGPGSQGSNAFGWRSWAPTGCSIQSVKIGRGVVRPADDISAKAWFWFSLSLRIVESDEAT